MWLYIDYKIISRLTFAPSRKPIINLLRFKKGFLCIYLWLEIGNKLSQKVNYKHQETQANLQLRLKKERKKEEKKNQKLAGLPFLLYNVASIESIMRCHVTLSKKKSCVKMQNWCLSRQFERQEKTLRWCDVKSSVVEKVFHQNLTVIAYCSRCSESERLEPCEKTRGTRRHPTDGRWNRALTHDC